MNIVPRFNFSGAAAAEGVGQNHTSEPIPHNDLAHIKFNEYERVMVDVCNSIGDCLDSLDDELSGIAGLTVNNIGGALRFIWTAHNSALSGLTTTTNTHSTQISQLDARESGHYSQLSTRIGDAETLIASNYNTLNTNKLNVSGGTITGNLTVNGTMGVGTNLTVGGELSVASTLRATSNLIVSTSAEIGGYALISSYLQVNGLCDLRANLTVSGSITAGAISGTTFGCSDLNASGNLSLTGTGKYINVGGNILRNSKAPENDTEIGTRGYNDTRYARLAIDTTFQRNLTVSMNINLIGGGGYAINLNGSRINGIGTPLADTDIATLGYNDARYVRKDLPFAMSSGTVEGDFTINGKLIGGLPVGVVLMYDGSTWVDNVTLPGYYSCISDNSSHGCPNLVDKFIMGVLPSDRGQTGGANSINLAVTQIPEHTHSIAHSHETHEHAITAAFPHTHSIDHAHLSTDTVNGSHTHADLHTHGTGSTIQYVPGTGTDPSVNIPGAVGAVSVSSDGTHNHETPGAYTGNPTLSLDISTDDTVVVNPDPAASGSAGSGAAIDNRPSYYGMIFIRRCA